MRTEEDFEEGELDGTVYDPRGNEEYDPEDDSESEDSESDTDSEDTEGDFDGSGDLEDAEIARQPAISSRTRSGAHKQSNDPRAEEDYNPWLRVLDVACRIHRIHCSRLTAAVQLYECLSWSLRQ